MYGDTWQVRWKEFLSDSYVYGSKIEFNEDGSVSYKNRLMPPGTVIHTWYSMTNFQGNRIEPSLPLIDGERAYSIAVNIDYHNSESEALMLRIIFFDRYDAQAQSIIVRDKKAFFKPSIRTYSYRIELINGGNADFTFFHDFYTKIGEYKEKKFVKYEGLYRIFLRDTIFEEER